MKHARPPVKVQNERRMASFFVWMAWWCRAVLMHRTRWSFLGSLPQPLPKGKGFGAALTGIFFWESKRQRDKESKRRRDGETKRRRDGETERRGVKETERRGVKETGSQRGKESKRRRVKETERRGVKESKRRRDEESAQRLFDGFEQGLFNGCSMVVQWLFNGRSMVVQWSFNGCSMVGVVFPGRRGKFLPRRGKKSGCLVRRSDRVDFAFV